jgi:two-component system, chemotaxis family, CheB/CheR fusion protein
MNILASRMTSAAQASPSATDSTIDRGLKNSQVRLVGVASSAGGLEALREMLPHLPETDALSYVIAQHLSPDHKSKLVELLAPKTGLILQTLEDSQQVQAGTIYVVAPNRNVVYRDGMLLQVDSQHTVGPKPSADVLFHSLAECLGDESIGIVLSGTGSDGSAGLCDIKAAGGVTIAQEIASAKFDGMPKAAIQTGSVDLVLRPEAIGPLLLRLVSEPRETAIYLDNVTDGDEFIQIAKIVRLRTSFRLDEYKSGTVGRRITRRLSLLGLQSLAEYVAYLKANSAEAQLLVRDCFISVTSFFRDAEAYQVLDLQIADIVQRAQPGAVRCWVAGCATGEEAYSIAMLFEEAIRLSGRQDLQYIIFASDLDEAALEHARAATYSKIVLDEIPKALRDRYVEARAILAACSKAFATGSYLPARTW